VSARDWALFAFAALLSAGLGLWLTRAAIPPGGWLERALPTLARLASAAALSDSAVAARVHVAPWFSPPR
jgi:hypothetical protein